MDRSQEIALQVRYLTASINSEIDQINLLMNELTGLENSEKQSIETFPQFRQASRISIRKPKP